MPHAVSMPSPGLQALILCGPGSSFPTFTSNPEEHPKALLPIGNRPMVWYPLEFCYRMGITDITLVCPPSTSKAIQSALSLHPALTSLPLPSPTVLAPKDLEQNTGTADILRLPEIQRLVTSDFVVLPCDLVCEMAGEKLLQAWMVKSAALPDLFGDAQSPKSAHSGGLGVWYQTKVTPPIKGQETDFVATTPIPRGTTMPAKDSLLPNLSKLVYTAPTDSLKDLLDEQNGLNIRQMLLDHHPKVRMLATHRDAHIYIFPHWVLDFVAENEVLESIGEDVLGWWAKSEWQTGLTDKLKIQEVLGDANKHPRSGSPGNETSLPRSPAAAGAPGSNLTPSPERGVTSATSLQAMQDSMRKVQLIDTEEHGTMPPMLAYIHPSQADQPLIRRVDTAQLLLATSLQLAKIPSIEETGPHGASPFAHARKVAYPEGVKQRTTITKQDSLVAENVTVDEKSSIKESVVGINCQIKEGAKLSQCLLMDGVVVGKNCKLTRCILGKRCEIGDGSVLTDCEVQENLLVEPKSEEKDSKLMSSSGLEATEEDMELLEEGEDLPPADISA